MPSIAPPPQNNEEEERKEKESWRGNGEHFPFGDFSVFADQFLVVATGEPGNSIGIVKIEAFICQVFGFPGYITSL